MSLQVEGLPILCEDDLVQEAITWETKETSQSVRRLTPTECERLQGLPDGWTHVHGAPMVGDTPLWETLLRSRLRNGLGDES